MRTLLGIDIQPNIVSVVFRRRGLIVLENFYTPPLLTYGLREKYIFDIHNFCYKLLQSNVKI